MALLKRSEFPEKEYDVIVVGSGIGGLTLAHLMARENKRVLLLEAHNKLGGLATWFYRDKKKYAFDVSLHGFPAAMKKTVRRYWPAVFSQESRIERVPTIAFQGPKRTFQCSFDRPSVTNNLKHIFAVPEKVVEAFFHECEQSFRGDNPYEETIEQALKRLFPAQPDVVPYLLGPIQFANGSTLSDPFPLFSIVFLNFMKQGIWTFTQGTDTIMREFRDALLDLGVDIKLNAEVEGILTSASGTEGVRLNGKTVKSKTVASNAHLFSSLHEELFHRQGHSLVKESSVETNISSTQVYMGLKENVTPEIEEHMIFQFDQWDVEKANDYPLRPTARTFTIYRNDSRQHPISPRSLIVATSNASYSKWKKLSPEDYRAIKEEIAADALEHLKRIGPKLAEEVEWVEVSSPLSIERFARTHRGASYGTKAGGKAISDTFPKRFPGLFHVGSVEIMMSGWLGTANFAAIRSLEVLSYLDSFDKNSSTLVRSEHAVRL